MLRRDRRSVLQIGAAEAARDDEVFERLGMERPHMRDVADEALEECDPARRVQRFENDSPARPYLVKRQLEEAQEILRLEVFDHLRGEDAAERGIFESREVA